MQATAVVRAGRDRIHLDPASRTLRGPVVSLELLLRPRRGYLRGNCDRFLLFRNGTIEEHEDFEEVYFQYKMIIGEAFETKEEMVAVMEQAPPKREQRRAAE